MVYVATPIVVDPSEPLRPYVRPDNTLIDVFGSRWDSSFYVDIVRNGYTYQNVPLPSVAFFPLLPLLIRGVGFVVGDVLVAGLLVTNTALLAAMMVLYRLVDHEWGGAVADRAVWYMLIFPTSFFGSAIYSESLFLLCAVAALYTSRSGRWTVAGGAGFFAALSRPVGVLIAPMLVMEWWMQHRRAAPHKRPGLAALCALLLVPLGLALYMVYLQWTFGDALAFVRAQASWGRQQSVLGLLAELMQQPAEGWTTAVLAGRLRIDIWIDATFTMLFLMLSVVLLWQRRWSEGVFMILNMLVLLNGGAWISQRRHVWVLFPAFVVLARWGERWWLDRIITVLFLLGLGVFSTMFANWYWVA